MDINGGELIATGSSSCVFMPNLPCSKKSKINKDRISKIMYSNNAVLDSLDEKRMNDKIKKIKGYTKWAIIFDEFCKPMKKDQLYDYDEQGIYDCLDEEDDSSLIDSFDNNSYMMNGIYGGVTLVDYFENIFFNKVKEKNFNNEFSSAN